MLQFLPFPMSLFGPLNVAWLAALAGSALWGLVLLALAWRGRRVPIALWFVPVALVPMVVLVSFPVLVPPMSAMPMGWELMLFAHAVRVVRGTVEGVGGVLLVGGTVMHGLQAVRRGTALRTPVLLVGAFAATVLAVFAGLGAVEALLPVGTLALAVTLGTGGKGHRRWGLTVALCTAQAVLVTHGCRDWDRVAQDLSTEIPMWWEGMFDRADAGPFSGVTPGVLAQAGLLPLLVGSWAVWERKEWALGPGPWAAAAIGACSTLGLLALGHDRLFGIPLGIVSDALPAVVAEDGVTVPSAGWVPVHVSSQPFYVVVTVAPDGEVSGRVAGLFGARSRSYPLGSLDDVDLGLLYSGLGALQTHCMAGACGASSSPLLAVPGDLPLGELSGLAEDLRRAGQTVLLFLVSGRGVPDVVEIRLVGPDRPLHGDLLDVASMSGRPVSEVLGASPRGPLVWRLPR